MIPQLEFRAPHEIIADERAAQIKRDMNKLFKAARRAVGQLTSTYSRARDRRGRFERRA